MITIQAKKHDNFSVEFKFGFVGEEGADNNDFIVNSWIFVPNSIGVNPETYGKNQFYRDVKSNVRLITPVFLLREIAEDSALPLSSLRHALEQLADNPTPAVTDGYEYHLKMFAAIFKSALRNSAYHIRTANALDKAVYLLEDYISNASTILKKFRALYRIIDVPTVPEKVRKHIFLADEFMSHIVEMQTIRIIRKIDSAKSSERLSELRAGLMALIAGERDYKHDMHYDIIGGDSEHNRQVVYHHGMLKKYVESDLYIRLTKRRDGVAVEQLYYSIAAGIAMIFATAVAWFTQVRYGNITLPLFIVLVISYMLKDRIKDLMRYYFAHKLGNKYYDKKAKITIGAKKVGVIKEGVDFISATKTPEQVMSMRNNAATIDDATRIFEEKIILFRKRVTIDGKVLAENDDYPMRGINEIMRLHLTRFTQKMDNPEIPVDTVLADGSLSSVKVQKIYYINIVFQLQHADKIEYRHFRVVMTRDGVLRVENM